MGVAKVSKMAGRTKSVSALDQQPLVKAEAAPRTARLKSTSSVQKLPSLGTKNSLSTLQPVESKTERAPSEIRVRKTKPVSEVSGPTITVEKTAPRKIPLKKK